jgi:glycosyltransferase involved in cell wall biosynthesis
VLPESKSDLTFRVSVVIPTRNRLEKLCRALASIEQQTCRDYEVWLVDDGSTDGTREFVDKNGEFTIMIAFVEDPDGYLLFFAQRTS